MMNMMIDMIIMMNMNMNMNMKRQSPTPSLVKNGTPYVHKNMNL